MRPRISFDPGLSRAATQRSLAQALADMGFETAALDARVLLCGALGIDHAALVRDPDLPLGASAACLEAFAQRRMMHEPVARILGRKEFFGESYAIDSAVLDPRPDTETLVEAVLGALAGRESEALRVLDLGVGSGAILGALLGRLKHATGLGVDRSPAACAVARRNLSVLGLSDRTAVVAGHWTAPLRGRFDLIVSNPPYIASAEIGGLAPEVRLHDPHLALDGGVDGLDAYRAILSVAAQHLAVDGLIGLEMGAHQRDAVESILRNNGFKSVSVIPDLAGHDRAAVAGLEFPPSDDKFKQEKRRES